MKFTALILGILCLCAVNLSAQVIDSSERERYANDPVWIKMIDDPTVNYYEAVEAFEEFWKGKVEPEEESELINEGKITEEDAEKMRAERAQWTQAERNEYETLKYEFKRFKQWKRDVFPYVQSDGRILSEKEKTDIYNKQKGHD